MAFCVALRARFETKKFQRFVECVGYGLLPSSSSHRHCILRAVDLDAHISSEFNPGTRLLAQSQFIQSSSNTCRVGKWMHSHRALELFVFVQGPKMQI